MLPCEGREVGSNPSIHHEYLKDKLNEMKAINEGWTKINGDEIKDLESYIFNQLATKKNVSIMIGTDSLLTSHSKPDKHRLIKYMSVIVFKSKDENFRDVNHVIKRRFEEKKYGKVPTAVKLNGEINLTAKLGMWMKEIINVTPEIHLDLNTSEQFGSFEVYNYIKGYFESLQFKTFYKPNSNVAGICADYFI